VAFLYPTELQLQQQSKGDLPAPSRVWHLLKIFEDCLDVCALALQ